MKKKTILTGAMAALLALPVMAQESITINGSLINSYSYGYDYTGSTSGTGWHQTSVGNGAWIDDEGVGQSTGEANIGLMSINTADISTTEIERWSKTQATTYKEQTTILNDFNWLIRDHVMYSNAGGVYVGGNTYYSFYMTEANAGAVEESEYGSEEYVVYVRKYTWDGVDAATGRYTNVQRTQLSNSLKVQPLDLTYDPLNDIVYGVFYDGNTYKFGTIDMETLQVSYISKEGFIWGAPQCVAINSKGELYAIDGSGNVYRVDRTDGSLTTVGNVGFQSQQMRMSATFDLRTDKLYWVGFLNDGKNSYDTSGTNTTLLPSQGGRDTGLFEINTQTGAATLVGELYQPIGGFIDPTTGTVAYTGYRGLQMTGIYVEGSFTRKNIDQRIILTKYPSQLKAGEQASVKVNVKNIGLSTVRGRDYKVNFYVNDQIVATIDENSDPVYTDNLKVNESQELEFTFTAPQSGNITKVYAEVVNSGDEETRNNKTEVAEIVLLSGKTVPTVVLNGAQNGSTVNLTWADPAGHVLDGAEGYAAFCYDGLNDWVMVDGDGGYTQKPNNMFSTIDYANWNTPKAFIVMDPQKAGFGRMSDADRKRFAAHSGHQYFAAFYSADIKTQSECDNNDYMISPILSGDAQTISFWAKGYKGTEATGYETELRYNETLEVLYADDAENLDPTTYQVAKETFKVNEDEWEQYFAELPAGAIRFALHRNSLKREYTEYEGSTVEIPGTGSFVMMIDDIEFKVTAQEVVGYKVYKNGALLNGNLSASTTTYNVRGANLDEDYFTVTALYADGTESLPSNIIGTDPTTGIQQVLKAAQQSGRRIYDMNGRAVQGQLRPGLYIIQQDGKARKVVVR